MACRKNMRRNPANSVADDSTRRLTRRLIEEGGVTLQRFKWTPAPGNPYSGDQRLLALSLEALLEFYTPGRLESLLKTLWSENAQAFLIFGETILTSSEFSADIRRELLELNKTSAVDMRTSCLRLAPQTVGISDRRKMSSNQNVFDSIQICSGLVIGSRQVSLGIAYRDIDNCNEELSSRLRWMARQIQQDQSAILPLIRSHNRQPNVGRALVNSQTGELIWNNALARVGWTDKSKFIELLIRPDVPVTYQTPAGENVDLTLITFLRSAQVDQRELESPRSSHDSTSNAQTNDSAAGAMDSRAERFLPDSITRRLKKVIFSSEKMKRSSGRISSRMNPEANKADTAQESRDEN